MGFKIVSDGSMDSHYDEVKQLKHSSFFKHAHENQLRRDKKKQLTLVCEHPKTWKYV